MRLFVVIAVVALAACHEPPPRFTGENFCADARANGCLGEQSEAECVEQWSTVFAAADEAGCGEEANAMALCFWDTHLTECRGNCDEETTTTAGCLALAR